MGKICDSCGEEILDPKLPDDQPEQCENCSPPEEGAFGDVPGMMDEQDEG